MSDNKQAPLTGSARVHRVFHRIGVVLGGLLLLVSLGCFASYTWEMWKGPTVYETIADLPEWARPTQINDVYVQERHSSKVVPIGVYLAKENESHRKYYEIGLSETRIYAFAFAGAAMALYLAIRAIGWIVAGAFRY